MVGRHYICKYYEKFVWRGHRIVSFTAMIASQDDISGSDHYMIAHTDDYHSFMFQLNETMTASDFVRQNGIDYERL